MRFGVAPAPVEAPHRGSAIRSVGGVWYHRGFTAEGTGYRGRMRPCRVPCARARWLALTLVVVLLLLVVRVLVRVLVLEDSEPASFECSYGCTGAHSSALQLPAGDAVIAAVVSLSLLDFAQNWLCSIGAQRIKTPIVVMALDEGVCASLAPWRRAQ